MMEQAVQELRGEPVETDLEPEIAIGVPAYIPETWLDDVNQRLVWYKRLAAMKRPEERVLLAEEMTDRYGPPPAIVETLLDVMDLRRRLKALGIEEAKLKGPRLALLVHPSTTLPPEALVEFVRGSGGRMALTPDRILWLATPARGEALISELRALLGALEGLLPRPSRTATAAC